MTNQSQPAKEKSSSKFPYSVIQKYSVDIDRPGVFKPTGTTWELLNFILPEVITGTKVLDLGCGCGLLGLELLEKFNGKLSMHFSDLSEIATKTTEENSERTPFKGKIEVKSGSLLEPWEGRKFDFIVDDISAVVPEIGNYFGWFSDAPNESGDQGSDLALEVITSAPKYFKGPDSKLAVPLISLSNIDLQLSALDRTFTEIRYSEPRVWPVGPYTLEIEELANKYPFVKFGKMAGMATFTTQVAVASKPREFEF